MKETKNFKGAFKDSAFDERAYASMFPKTLIGAKIVDLRYGPDHEGDPCLYYIELDDGVKIGICKCVNTADDVDIEELDRTEQLEDGSFIRFQFHDWPKYWQKTMEEYTEEED